MAYEPTTGPGTEDDVKAAIAKVGEAAGLLREASDLIGMPGPGDVRRLHEATEQADLAHQDLVAYASKSGSQ